jgi:hypothetical protein
MGSREIRISNYEFSFVLFSSVQIFICATAVVLPFRQYPVVVSSSAGRRPAVMKVIAFQAKVSR